MSPAAFLQLWRAWRTARLDAATVVDAPLGQKRNCAGNNSMKAARKLDLHLGTETTRTLTAYNADA